MDQFPKEAWSSWGLPAATVTAPAQGTWRLFVEVDLFIELDKGKHFAVRLVDSTTSEVLFSDIRSKSTENRRSARVSFSVPADAGRSYAIDLEILPNSHDTHLNWTTDDLHLNGSPLTIDTTSRISAWIIAAPAP